MATGTYSKSNSHFVFAGLVVVNICAIYVAGSTGIYAATAFREYGRIDLFNLVFVIEPLARSIALLVSGRLGESFGLKKFYLWSVLAFAVTVAICAAAPNGMTFLIARSFTGFFWGLFLTNAFAIVNEVFPQKEYSVRVGALQTVSSLIYIVGPIICGAIIEKESWQISLGVLLPLLVIGLLLVGLFMPQSKESAPKSADLSISTASNEKHRHQIKKQLQSIQVDVLLKQQGYAVLILIISIYTFVYCTGNYIPLYAQTELKASVTVSAMVLVPCNIMGMLFSSLSGVYITKKGCSKKLVLLMSGAALSGSLLYIRATTKPGFPIIILATAILGIGAGIYQVMPFSYVQKYMKKDLMAKGTSFIGFIEGIASVVAGLLYSAAMKNGVSFGLASASIFGVCVFVLTALKYREPDSKSLDNRKEVQK